MEHFFPVEWHLDTLCVVSDGVKALPYSPLDLPAHWAQ